MRDDGLSVVLGPLVDDRALRAAVLTDGPSGMVLDACVIGDATVDIELLGGRHAELMRIALTLSTASADRRVELVVDDGAGWFSVLRSVSDPLGEPLVLSAVVHGTARQCHRIRRRLREVPADALVAGPSLRRRPVDGRWALGGAPPVPQQPMPAVPGPMRALRPGPLSALPAGPPPLLQQQVFAANPDLGQPSVVLR